MNNFDDDVKLLVIRLPQLNLKKIHKKVSKK